MAIVPFQPTFDPFANLLDTLAGMPGGHAGLGAEVMRAPATDVIEGQNDIRVLMEMPGIKRQNIDIDVENNVLTVTAEKSEHHQQGQPQGQQQNQGQQGQSPQQQGQGRQGRQQGTYHLSERRFGRFSRSFVLPRGVEQDKISADFEDGILTITLPKSEQAKRRQIQVGAGQQGGQQEGREIPVQSQGQQGQGQPQGPGQQHSHH